MQSFSPEGEMNYSGGGMVKRGEIMWFEQLTIFLK